MQKGSTFSGSAELPITFNPHSRNLSFCYPHSVKSIFNFRNMFPKAAANCSVGNIRDT